MIDRKQTMCRQRQFLFVSIYLCFSITAADILKDLGNFPICAQACWTEALAKCTPKCTLTDLACICSCSSFQANVKSCVSSSCAPSHLQEAGDFMSKNCEAIATTTSSLTTKTSSSTTKTSTTSTSPSPTRIFTTPTTHQQPGGTSISPGIFPPTASPAPSTWTTTYTFQSWTTTYTGTGLAPPKPTSPGNTPPSIGPSSIMGPSSIIGPACVPIHNEPNSSYPTRSNWTNGIVFVNGTWMNSSCVPSANGTGYGYEMVGVNVASGLMRTGWVVVALAGVLGVMVGLG